MITLKNEKLTVQISEIGAEVHSIKNEQGREFIWNGDKKYWPQHAPILFPICGQLYNDTYYYEGKKYSLPCHGFAPYSEFMVTEQSETDAVFCLASNEETRKCYPFEFEFKVKYTLIKNQVLTEFFVKNIGCKNMLFAVGSHEAYMMKEGIENYYLEFPRKTSLVTYDVADSHIMHGFHTLTENSDKYYLKNEDFKTGATVFEDTDYKSITIKTTEGKDVLKLDFEDFPHIILWAPVNGPFLCIEPWNGFPEYKDTDQILEHKKGMIPLAPQAEYHCKHLKTVYPIGE